MAERLTIKIDKGVERLPMIPLRGLVVFPNNVVHFEVGRNKSIAAIEWAIANTNRVFLVAQRDTDIEEPSQKDLYKYGVVAEIKQVLKASEGIVKVIVEGKYRAKLLNYENGEKYYASCIKSSAVKNVKEEQELEANALLRSIKDLFEKYLEVNPKLSKDVAYTILSGEDILFLSEYIPANLLLKYTEKQDILEQSNVLERMKLIYSFMLNEYRIAELEREIEEKVDAQMDKNQREYYLREQLHVIGQELGESDDILEETITYKKKILALNLTKEITDKLIKEVDRMSKMPGNSPEAMVVRSYLDTVLELPWGEITSDNLDVVHARNVLNRDHYGLEKVKDRILEIIAVRKLCPEIKSQIICLVGPPGIGKTSIAHSVAECLNRKFVRMSLGGVHDEAEIRGHRRTYIGSMPGKIISSMINAKSMNPVILLDEIDKMGGDYRGDPSSAMLEVLDPEQNKSFRDHYLDIPFDLSQVLFITTANTLETIPGPLKDRMDVIELSSYTREEKFNIAKRHLIPKQLKNNGLSEKILSFRQSAIYSIIDGYVQEAGVRNLERTLIKIMRKCAVTVAEGKEERIIIGNKDVEQLLGPKTVKENYINRNNTVGMANGLAWTSIGGATLPIEVAIIENGSGKIEITGSLGEVMKESAKIAFTLSKIYASEYGIESDRLNKIDLHIHAPEGAIPKDGPSAGVTLLTALISALSDSPVKSSVAMTGEISLHGDVLPIGGLREKSMAAFKEGIYTVLIPYDNMSDLYEIDAVVKEKINFIPVKTVKEVLAYSLLLHENVTAATKTENKKIPKSKQERMYKRA